MAVCSRTRSLEQCLICHLTPTITRPKIQLTAVTTMCGTKTCSRRRYKTSTVLTQSLSLNGVQWNFTKIFSASHRTWNICTLIICIVLIYALNFNHLCTKLVYRNYSKLYPFRSKLNQLTETVSKLYMWLVNNDTAAAAAVDDDDDGLFGALTCEESLQAHQTCWSRRCHLSSYETVFD